MLCCSIIYEIASFLLQVSTIFFSFVQSWICPLLFPVFNDRTIRCVCVCVLNYQCVLTNLFAYSCLLPSTLGIQETVEHGGQVWVWVQMNWQTLTKEKTLGKSTQIRCYFHLHCRSQCLQQPCALVFCKLFLCICCIPLTFKILVCIFLNLWSSSLYSNGLNHLPCLS